MGEGEVAVMVLEVGLVAVEMARFPLRLRGWLVVVDGVGVFLFACVTYVV